MIDTLEYFDELKKFFEPSQAETLAKLLGKIYKEVADIATKKELVELIEVVKSLSEKINKLAEAQERTEGRLAILEEKMAELAEAQKKTEERVNELAQAQKKTEERLNILEEKMAELAEAQKKTEERMNELAQAQKKTEESLRVLIKRVEKLEDRVEGISDSVGYSLENASFKALPKLLKKEGIEVIGNFIRRYWREEQINIWGKGRLKDKEILILGEAKVRPSKKEILKFIKTAEDIKKAEKAETFLIFVAHDYPPIIEEYLKEKSIKYYWSYEFEER